MKTLPVLAAIVIALGWSQTVLAQGASPNAAMAARIAEARKANAALMQQYSWTSRTEVIDQGQVKDIRIDSVNYGPGGQLQRSPLNDQESADQEGTIKERLTEPGSSHGRMRTWRSQAVCCHILSRGLGQVF